MATLIGNNLVNSRNLEGQQEESNVQNIKNKKLSEVKKKDDAKERKKLAKSLDFFGTETGKQFDVTVRSYLGTKPVLSLPNKEQDDISKNSFTEEQEIETKKRKTKNINFKSSTSTATEVKAKDKRNPPPPSETKIKGQTIASEALQKTSTTKQDKKAENVAKSVKPESNTIKTQKEMDEFISDLDKGMTKYQKVIDKIYNKEVLGKKNQVENEDKAQAKDSKISKNEHSKDSVNTAKDKNLSNKEKATINSQKVIEKFNTPDANSPKKHSSTSKLTADDKTIKHSDKDSIQEIEDASDRIKSARKYAMALKGNIQSIANNASLQSLIAAHLDTRGSYAVKIFLAMYKLKQSKAKTTSEDLQDQQHSRSLESDRKILTEKKMMAKIKEAEDRQHQMSIVSFVVALVALLVATIITICTAGAGAPVLGAIIVLAIGFLASASALVITGFNTFQTGYVDGHKMGAFDGFIYKKLRGDGCSETEARKGVMYTNIAIQVVVLVLTFAAGFAGAGKVASLASEAGAEGRAASAAKNFVRLVKSVVSTHGAAITRTTKILGNTLTSMGMAAQAGMGINKAYLEKDAADLHANSIDAQAKLEHIEQEESRYKALMMRNVKRLNEQIASVKSTLQEEYQAIKMLNTRNKVA